MAAKPKRPAMSQAMIRPIRRVSRPLTNVWGFIVWLVGVLVSLAVGLGMVNGTLSIEPYIPGMVTIVAGWVVVVLAILGLLLKIVDLTSR